MSSVLVPPPTSSLLAAEDPAATAAASAFSLLSPPGMAAPTPPPGGAAAAAMASGCSSGGLNNAGSNSLALEMAGGGGVAAAGGVAGAGYDWHSEENASRWRGLFMAPLEKILRQSHHQLQLQLTAELEALEYVEGLLLKLLAMLTAKPTPLSVLDIEDRVSRTFPSPIDKKALGKAQSALDRGKKKSHLVLPVDKVHSILKEVLQNNKLEDQISLYLMAILEYISTEIFKLAVNYVINSHHQHITCQDIKAAISIDKGQVLLMDMFDQEDVMLYMEDDATPCKEVLTYDEVVKDLIMDEKQYQRDLFMITKVFRDLIQQHGIASASELEAIFSNVNDVTELTMTLIGSLEDTLEMTEEDNVPAIGSCFEELAEAVEFDVYAKFAYDILSPKFSFTLDALLSRQEVSDALLSTGHGFRAAVKFYLPMLLLEPIYHCFHYFKYIALLKNLTPSEEEADTLKQVAAMITPLQNKLQLEMQQAGLSSKRKPGDVCQRLGSSRIGRQQSLQKLCQLQQSITDWEGKDIATNSSELVCEGKLKVFTESRKRFVERYVFLCDGIIIICKQSTKKGSMTSSSSSSIQCEYHLKDKHLIKRLEVIDREDGFCSGLATVLPATAITASEDLRHTFELAPKDHHQPRIVFKAESEEEKNSWMAALVMLNTKSMLERRLDDVLAEEERRHPLRFPPCHLYQFAEPNSSQNIVFENREKAGGVPLIKGATLVKLVERLTYHVYADPMFMKTFLTTYRSFSNPNELLDLLIERFNIPDPEFSSDSESDSEVCEKSSKMRMAQDIKRFRKEYSQPVQFRVLNVLKHWVDQHFYDFDQDLELLGKLTCFLDTISGKSMRKWVECINKIIQRRRLGNEDCKEDVSRGIYPYSPKPPPREVHIENPKEGWPELLTFHPIEIARQLTLLEFQYYRAVKPSELVDQAWTRKDKDKRSPNLLKMVRHTTNFTFSLEKLIVETDNTEERVAVVQRILEIMVVLQEYNNFNGVLAITSAMNSSAIHRLSQTKERVPNNLLKALEDASSYVKDHFKIYWERLRSINPPCVPFFGRYQTNILFLEEGNPDFLQDTNLINFSKRRKVAEIISEIQQYQNQPYCLDIYPELTAYLENLEPFPNTSEKDIIDYLWSKSVEIEPRQSDQPQRKRPEPEKKYKGLNLRSPGIKPRAPPSTKNPPNPLERIRQPNRNKSENAEENDSSPLTSPVFRCSPQSVPSTPLLPVVLAAAAAASGTSSSPATASGTQTNSGFQLPSSSSAGVSMRDASTLTTGPSFSPTEGDPIKIPVMLPGGPHQAHAAGVPPPLPPKPSKNGLPELPPILLRQPSPPPPPLPPRRDQHPHHHHHHHHGLPPRLPYQPPVKSPLESRSPLMDPVEHRRNSSSAMSLSSISAAAAPHLGPRSESEVGPPPPPATTLSSSPLWGAMPHSPSWMQRQGLPLTTTKPDQHQYLRNHQQQQQHQFFGVFPDPEPAAAGATSSNNHFFTFSQQHLAAQGRQPLPPSQHQQQLMGPKGGPADPSLAPPRPPPSLKPPAAGGSGIGRGGGDCPDPSDNP